MTDPAPHPSRTSPTKEAVEQSLVAAPVVGVVRTHSRDEAREIARGFMAGGLELIEITFTVPDTPGLIAELRGEVQGDGPPFVGAGTVTTGERARAALEAGAQFLVSPNVSREVAEAAREAGVFLFMGALSATEIVAAHGLGADRVKVFPLAPVGGPAYLALVRGPLGDIPMLASGGYGIEEIPAYRRAGASAFGVGAPMVGATREETVERVRRALALARGDEETGS